MIPRSLLAATFLTLSATVASAQTPTLTISVYGISQDEYKAALYAPFEAMCGCKLVVESGNSSERLAKLEANAAAPIVDVIALSDADALTAARKNLTQPIDPSKVPNLAKIYDFARDPIGGHMAVGYTFYGTSIVYRSDKVKIDSWLDLFSDKLKGRVALPNITTTQGPLALFMLQRALGKDSADFADAIDLIGKNKGDIVTFYEKGSQIPQLMQQEEILAAVVGRFGWPGIKKINMPIAWAMPKEGQTGGMNVLALAKGSKQSDLALKFIDYWLSAEVQQKIAEKLVDSPVNADVKLAPAIADALTYGADTAAAIHFVPAQVQLGNREAWLKGWNAKIAR